MKEKFIKLITLTLIITSTWHGITLACPCDSFCLRPRSATEREFSLNTGNENVIGQARLTANSDFLIVLSNQVTANAADINFHPNDPRQGIGNQLGEFDDSAVYQLAEISSSENPNISLQHPGDRIILTGREVNFLGLGPHFPISALSRHTYSLRKISDRIPHAYTSDYDALLKDSLIRCKKYDVRQRFEKSFVANEIYLALTGGVSEFTKLFCKISKMVKEDPSHLAFSDISRVFSDIVAFSSPQVRNKLHEYLIDIALISQLEPTAENAYLFAVESLKSVNAQASADAIKILRCADIGEIVITSSETLWSSTSGGQGIYISDKARELASLGIAVTVVTPLFADKEEEIKAKYKLRDTGRTFKIKYGQNYQGGYETETVTIYEATIDGVRVLYLKNPKYFNKLKGKEGEDSAYGGKDAYKLRFARMLSLGTLLAIRAMNIHASVIHTNEWSTAYVKAYLEGRERIDPDCKNLREDPHFKRAVVAPKQSGGVNMTSVLSMVHNLEKGYQGRVETPVNDNNQQRDNMVIHDLGFDPGFEHDILFRPGEWNVINPTYTAVKTANHVRDVSKGHHDRSLDHRYESEMGGLTGLLRWKEEQGEYDGILNGFGLVKRQRDFLQRILVDPEKENRLVHLGEQIKANILNALADPAYGQDIPGYRNMLENLFGRPEVIIRGFHGLGDDNEKRGFSKLLCDCILPHMGNKRPAEFMDVVKKLFGFEILHRTRQEVRKRMREKLDDPNYGLDMPGYRAMVEDMLQDPERHITSFLEIGHDDDRRRLARFFFDFVSPVQRENFQKVCGLELGENKFIYSMLHRICEQKGHQLLVAEIWSKQDPGQLKAIEGQIFWNHFEDHNHRLPLNLEDQRKLEDYAQQNNRSTLRAVEVAMILHPDMQFIVAGGVGDDRYNDQFWDIYNRFSGHRQFVYISQFVSMDDPLYDLIYSGSTRFGMPSRREPGGLSNQEAAAYGVPRHIARRDGLKDGEIKLPEFGFEEAFDIYNPVEWVLSLGRHYAFFKNNPQQGERELKYRAITQDNRWLLKTKNYIELYRRMTKSPAIRELDALEVASAIHRAQIMGHKDPADELMKSGFTAEEAMTVALDCIRASKNLPLVNAFIERHIPSLGRIQEISASLRSQLQAGISRGNDKKIQRVFRRAYRNVLGDAALEKSLEDREEEVALLASV